MSKERLVELHEEAVAAWDAYLNMCEEQDVEPEKTFDEFVADYLLANGVIVPPCKVGQILFIIEAGLIYEAKVKEYKYCSNSTNGVHWHIRFEELFVMTEAHIGKTIFYTREEAVAKLKGDKIAIQ